MRRLISYLPLTALAASVVLAGGSAKETATDNAQEQSSSCRQLSDSLEWYGDNRELLQSAISEAGSCNKEQPPGTAKPFAVFDFDDTLIKNDVSDALRYWMLRNDKVKPPTNGDWHTRSVYLTDEAADLLSSKCGTETTPAETLPTSRNSGCTDEIVNVIKGETSTGSPAFQNVNARTANAGYMFGASMLTGYSKAEIEDMVRTSRAENLAAPIGATQQVGSGEVTAYARYYDQMKDLVGTLQDNGIDVYVMSASPEVVVETWSEELNIPADKSFGTRYIFENDVFTPHSESCGGAPLDTVIPYIDGKRCWINQAILNIQGSAALQQAPESSRQILAGGDSDTDITFVSDATATHLAINKNGAELMCSAYHNADGKWIVNPMFIEPKAQRRDPYPCSSTARRDSDGTRSPALDQNGNPIPDQPDKVF